MSKKGNQVWNYISQVNAQNLSENMYAKNETVKSYLVDSNAWNYICEYIIKGKTKTDIKNSTNYGNYYDREKVKYSGLKGLYALRNYVSSNSGEFFYNYGILTASIAPGNEGDIRLELATGISEDFKIYNIYDMAGNMAEWSAETTNEGLANGTNEKTSYGVLRGGSSFERGSEGSCPIVFSSGDTVILNGTQVTGFRMVLYLK